MVERVGHSAAVYSGDGGDLGEALSACEAMAVKVQVQAGAAIVILLNTETDEPHEMHQSRLSLAQRPCKFFGSPYSAKALPQKGSRPEWKFDDFFALDLGGQQNLKLALAQEFDVQYCTVNKGKRFANDVDGIPAYTVKRIEDMLAAQAAATSAKDDVALLSSVSVSTVVNGCQVNWPTPDRTFNIGYIERWATEHLNHWDKSVERKGGGLEHGVDLGAQCFVCTNVSSLYALLATVVQHYMTGTSMKSELKDAFLSIRLVLLLSSSSSEITLLNDNENTEQAERKRSSEVDLISSVQLWMSSMKHLSKGKLDANKALDVFKFAASLRDPRQPLPVWLKALLREHNMALRSEIINLLGVG
jgi:hypothetical protein